MTTEPRLVLSITERERDTVLAALRLWQEHASTIRDTPLQNLRDEPLLNLAAIATNFGEHMWMTDSQLDDLCESVGAADPTVSTIIVKADECSVFDVTAPPGVVVETRFYPHWDDIKHQTPAELRAEGLTPDNATGPEDQPISASSKDGANVAGWYSLTTYPEPEAAEQEPTECAT